MSRRITFPTGLAVVGESWTTGVFKWMLVTDAWTQNEALQVYVSSLSAYELTDGSYSRQTMTTPSIVPVLAPYTEGVGMVSYLCDDPDFGFVVGGETASSLVLYAEVTNDADSPIVASYPIYYLADGLTSGVCVLSSAGAVATSTACLTGF